MVLILISLASDHGLSGIKPFKVSVIRNKWTPGRNRMVPASMLSIKTW